MSKFAVIRTGGKQYLVKAGDTVDVEKLAVEKTASISDVLLVASPDAKEFSLGTPKVSTKIETQVLLQGRAKKIRVVHYKPKVRHHKVYGHRQPFTKLKIGAIS